ncbi:hypothetical protein GC098_09920 [Paenibacillus sp. LMG 31458]|uniref:Uncharacterized protein n=1 Tax=Paenibacillus phytorum TaxID=2654977 RepID=A0ABX1XUM8_9BACL|nr:hypothetical protein [Paenibacillus phytorum]NOU71736.1 hypothetical protein [Paenibacillus phytorum]
MVSHAGVFTVNGTVVGTSVKAKAIYRVVGVEPLVPGPIRIIAASVGETQGVLAGGDLLTFKFTFKAGAQAPPTTISVKVSRLEIWQS